ncbi:MAG TPA: glutamate 5-kinase, partial [Planctomycetota bacterium]|nr:glutamate 5-kinase [Planctomycetota bacterium]
AGTVIAKGLTNYSSGELGKIKGAKTSQIKDLLGHKYYDEVIHRDNLVTIE